MESVCIGLQKALQDLAPICPPVPLPKCARVGLEELLSTEDATQLAALVQQNANPVSCGYCKVKGRLVVKPGAKAEDKDLQMILSGKWELNVERKLVKLVSLEYVCRQCRLLISPERSMNALASKSDLALPEHFVKVNQHDLSNIFQGKIVFQECYAMAYSLKVLLNNIKSVQIVNEKGQPLESQHLLALIQKKIGKVPAGEKAQPVVKADKPEKAEKAEKVEKTEKKTKKEAAPAPAPATKQTAKQPEKPAEKAPKGKRKGDDHEAEKAQPQLKKHKGSKN